MDPRSEIAEALNATGLVNISTYYRQSLKPFDGFVTFKGLGPTSNGFGWMGSWDVWLAIPQDNATAERWLDSNLTALMKAFDTVAIANSATPADLTLGGGTATNGIILSGITGYK